MSDRSLRKRSVDIGGHRTSVSIEQPFWNVLKKLADERGLSVNDLVTKIDSARESNLSSAIRVYVLRSLQNKTNG